jgi:hypothetical protein
MPHAGFPAEQPGTQVLLALHTKPGPHCASAVQSTHALEPGRQNLPEGQPALSPAQPLTHWPALHTSP